MTSVDDLRALVAPHVSEKAHGLSPLRQYVFQVDRKASKGQVAQVVAQVFSVQVAAVNVLHVQGKRKRFRYYESKRKNWKKAYVTLREGYTIDMETAMSQLKNERVA